MQGAHVVLQSPRTHSLKMGSQNCFSQRDSQTTTIHPNKIPAILEGRAHPIHPRTPHGKQGQVACFPHCAIAPTIETLQEWGRKRRATPLVCACDRLNHKSPALGALPAQRHPDRNGRRWQAQQAGASDTWPASEEAAAAERWRSAFLHICATQEEAEKLDPARPAVERRRQDTKIKQQHINASLRFEQLARKRDDCPSSAISPRPKAENRKEHQRNGRRTIRR